MLHMLLRLEIWLLPFFQQLKLLQLQWMLLLPPMLLQIVTPAAVAPDVAVDIAAAAPRCPTLLIVWRGELINLALCRFQVFADDAAPPEQKLRHLVASF